MDRQVLLQQIRELIELDRGFGVEFVARASDARARAASPVPAGPPHSPAAPAAPPSAARRASAPVALASPLTAPSPAAAAVSASTELARPGAGGADAGSAGDRLAAIAMEVAACRACGLCQSRSHTVPGEGAPQPALLFIGEGPGAEEDAQGRPFVGPAGQLLDKMILAMGLTRSEVFIVNVLKCRPPGNRTPEPEEVAACLGFLHRQIEVLTPRVICTLGNVPLRALFGADQPGITRSRGRQLTWRGITVIPTFHPSYLLRNEQAKKPAWEDLQVVLTVLGRPVPRRAGA